MCVFINKYSCLRQLLTEHICVSFIAHYDIHSTLLPFYTSTVLHLQHHLKMRTGFKDSILKEANAYPVSCSYKRTNFATPPYIRYDICHIAIYASKVTQKTKLTP